MEQIGAVLAWAFLALVVLGFVWAWKRGRRGYQMVMALQANLEAHASADADARALASNAVQLNLGGGSHAWAGGNDDLHFAIDNLNHDERAALRAALGSRDGVASDALGAGLRPGADRVLPGPSGWHQVDPVMRRRYDEHESSELMGEGR